MRYGSAGLSTTRIGLADRVRLLAQSLRRHPDCEAPSDAWGLALDAADMDRSAPEYRLLLPSRQLPTVEDAAASDPWLEEKPEFVHEADTHGDDAPSSQRPRLKAPVLAVVAADFEPATGQANAAERAKGLAPLASEDYEPIHPLATEPWIPLAPRTRWWPSLRRFAPQVSTGADLPRLVSQCAHGRLPRRLPRLQRRGWFRSLLVLEDTRRCMLPYRRDIEMLLDCLKAQRQAVTISVEKFSGLPPPVSLGVDGVLVLSDLGLCATPDPAATADVWTDWARALAARDIAVQAWVPVSALRIPAALARTMPCVPWHEDSRFRPSRGHPGVAPACAHQRDTWMARMWPVLSIAQRIEPALLRRARLMAGGRGQPEWEAALWQTSDEHVAGERVLQFWPARAPEWRQRFSRLSVDQQLQVWRMFTAQHGHLDKSTLVVEQLVWAAYAHPEARDAVHDSLAKAEDWLRKMKKQEAANSVARQRALQRGEDHALHSSFLHGLVARNGPDAEFTARYAEDYAPLALAVGRMGQGAGVPAEAWLGALSQTMHEGSVSWSLLLHHTPTESILEQCFWPVNTDIALSASISRTILPADERQASLWKPLGQSAQWLKPIHAAEPGELHFHDAHGTHRLKIDHLNRSDWQHALGCDRYGVFCEVLVKRMRLRFRYIPPSIFLQGSTQGIPYNEHPQHPVTLTRGLWLAEIPCTQALWQAVMGQNPSHFAQGEDAPRRPVESVSWDDVQVFLKALQRLLPLGCEAVLPTESQWECACRAGTQTAYWWGDEPDDARANWNQQHKGTTPVDRYPPNPWGMYDVHGNVWEWCADRMRRYAAEPAWDPGGLMEGTFGFHVFRGGSWLYPGPDRARAASRLEAMSSHTHRFLGFRFALISLRGPEAQPGWPGALRRGGAAGGLTVGADAPAAEPPRLDEDDVRSPE